MSLLSRDSTTRRLASARSFLFFIVVFSHAQALATSISDSPLLRREELEVKKVATVGTVASAGRHVQESGQQAAKQTPNHFAEMGVDASQNGHHTQTSLQGTHHHHGFNAHREHRGHDPAGTGVGPELMDDIFYFVDPQDCEAHGQWYHYKLTHFPLYYHQCAEACQAKEECLGFDWHIRDCRLFTILPVAFNSWGAVRFNPATGGPFGGANAAWATNAHDLGTPVLLNFSVPGYRDTAIYKPNGCFLRRLHRAARSYYHHKGTGKCTGPYSAETSSDTPLYSYTSTNSDTRELCGELCSKESLCIAYSFNDNTTTCHLFPQKTVHAWPGDSATNPSVTLVASTAARVWAQHPGLIKGEGPTCVGGAATCHDGLWNNMSCNVKTTWSQIDALYAHDGNGNCQDWKHVDVTVAHRRGCADECDYMAECVGFDFDATTLKCRLFPHAAPTGMTVIQAAENAAKTNTYFLDKFAGEPSVLAGEIDNVDHVDGQGCFKKTHYKSYEDFQLVGNQHCNGGGYWNSYQYEVNMRLHVSHCEAKCLERPECMGFDFSSTICTLYTCQSVPIGAWAGVALFNGGPAFGNRLGTELGRNGTEAFYVKEGFVTSVDDFNVTSHLSDDGTEDHWFHCFSRRTPRSPTSYYEDAGRGTCSLGGFNNYYTLEPFSVGGLAENLEGGMSLQEVCNLCQEACNSKDECLGYDCGNWSIDQSTRQVFAGGAADVTNTEIINRPACHMYPIKAVWAWNHVTAEQTGMPKNPPSLTGSDGTNRFARDPRDLNGESGLHTQFEVGDQTRCFRKTSWIDLDEYWIKGASQHCSPYMHYRHTFATTTPIDDTSRALCKEECDKWEACIGMDIDEHRCRFYTTHALNSPWKLTEILEIEKDTTAQSAFLGDKSITGRDTDDKYAFHVQELISYHTQPDSTTAAECWLKTHAPYVGETLSTYNN